MGMFGGSNETVTTTFKGVDQMSPVVRGIRSTMDQFKRDAATGFGLAGGISVFNMATRAIGAVTDFMGDAISKASDWEEANSKVGMVFGELAGDIRSFAGDAARDLGLSERAALATLGTFGNLFDALGTGSREAADMSKGLVQLAADLASFNNADVKDVLVALQSGLVGETEPMRRFGANLSAARVQAFALAEGLAASVKEITEADKVTVRYALIMQDTANAQGDFARTADGLANSQRTLTARVDDLSVSIGRVMQGPALSFVGFLEDVVTGLENINEALGGNERKMGAYMEKVQLLGARHGLTAKQIEAAEARISSLGFAFAEGTSDADKMAARLAAVEAEMRRMARGAQVAGRGMGETFELMGDDADTFGGRLNRTFAGFPKTVTHAVVDMKAAIKTGKAGIIEQFRDLAWQSKHPFAQVRYEDWLEKRAKAAMRKSRQAAKVGRVGVAEQYRALAASIRAELMGLPGYAASVTAGILAAMDPAVQMGFTWAGNTSTAGDGGTGRIGSKPRRRRNRRGGRRGGPGRLASGGPAWSGETYLIGEEGPELLRMGAQSGHVTPNHALGSGGPINVYIDGERLFRIMDARQGRAVAMG